MTRPTHGSRCRRLLGVVYLSVLVTLVIALVWEIASGGPA